MSTRQIISLTCALALTGGGLYWLAEIIIPIVFFGNGRFRGIVVAAAVMMTTLGAFWLWEDFVKPGPRS